MDISFPEGQAKFVRLYLVQMNLLFKEEFISIIEPNMVEPGLAKLEEFFSSNASKYKSWEVVEAIESVRRVMYNQSKKTFLYKLVKLFDKIYVIHREFFQHEDRSNLTTILDLLELEIELKQNEDLKSKYDNLFVNLSFII